MTNIVFHILKGTSVEDNLQQKLFKKCQHTFPIKVTFWIFLHFPSFVEDFLAPRYDDVIGFLSSSSKEVCHQKFDFRKESRNDRGRVDLKIEVILMTTQSQSQSQ